MRYLNRNWPAPFASGTCTTSQRIALGRAASSGIFLLVVGARLALFS